MTKPRDLANSVNSGSIPGTRLENDAITAIKMAPNSVDSSELANDAISTNKIQNAAITTAKVADGAVTTLKIADANVTTAKVADGAITTAKITDANVTTGKVADAAVTTAKIADANVTTAKVADGAITTAKVAGGPAFRAGQGTAFSVANSTWTKITFGTEQFDTASCYASNRFTPNVAGYYQVNGAVQYQGATTAALFGCAIAKNGSPDYLGVGLDTTLYARSTVSDLVYLNGTTDYVEIHALHSQGGAQDMLGEAFSAVWIRP